MRAGQTVWHYRHHLGGPSNSHNERKVMGVTREAVLNVKSAFGQVVKPGEVSARSEAKRI